ncbi:MAG: AAA family ATPase [Cyanobacteria bacterium P01_A01_bin.15]
MLRQILSIKNIGKLVDVKPAKGNTELAKLNIYYAQNGSGKTTLSAIFRSLCTNEAKHILGKKSAYGNGEPYVNIRCPDSNNYIFNNGSWQTSFPDIEIFDSKFIHDNIFKGSSIELNHRRNLYQFILGERGVSLARRLIEIDTRTKEINAALKQYEKTLRASIFGKMPTEDFLHLHQLDDIEDIIESQSNKVMSLAQAHEIVSKDKLKLVDIPDFNLQSLDTLLKKSIDDISDVAVRNIYEHISNCMDESGEPWIFQGLSYIRNEGCPFCGQRITESFLVENFRLLFREAYKALKKEVQDKRREYEKIFSERALRNVDRLVNENARLFSFWQNYLDFGWLDFDFNALENSISALQAEVDKLLLAKFNSPAEAIEVSKSLLESLNTYQMVSSQLSHYKRNIQELNFLIDAKKRETSDTDLEEAKKDLDRFRCIEKRYKPEISDVCNIYLDLQTERNKLKEEKTAKKEELDRYSESILTEHESAIRQHLSFFGAQFYPIQFQKDHSGGKPGFNFCIAINEKTINLGGANAPEDQPCFGNTLSEGDKQSLAFAFFLSKLDRDPRIADKVVIFDDPICSLDSNRREYTRQQILRIARVAKQVILLSHDPFFLKSVSVDYPSNDTKLFKIHAFNAQYSTIELWDIYSDTQSRYLEEFKILCDYLDGTYREEVAVARCIRPLLEANLRMRFPDRFLESEWLGDFIKKVRNCSEDSRDDPLSTICEKLEDLCAVNDYSKRYHHSENEIRPITSSELRVYVELTLNLIR